jgi:hypothetical protein
MLNGRFNSLQCNSVQLLSISECEYKNGSRDSSVAIGLGCGVDDLGVGVRFPAVAIYFFLPHNVQLSSWAHLTSYTIGNFDCFTDG